MGQWSRSQVLLLPLSIEKVVQHLFVTYAFVSEFVAQGTLAIDLVLSIIVATIILVILFRSRKTLLQA